MRTSPRICRHRGSNIRCTRKDPQIVPVSEIDVDQLESLDITAIQLIDVREPDEYAEARVPGAALVPLMTVPNQLERLDRDTAVYLICASGGRSLNAAEYLEQQGFEAVNIAGGTKAWVAHGKPFETGAVDS
jgi:rhodanese-related sulfurtransferase